MPDAPGWVATERGHAAAPGWLFVAVAAIGAGTLVVQLALAFELPRAPLGFEAAGGHPWPALPLESGAGDVARIASAGAAAAAVPLVATLAFLLWRSAAVATLAAVFVVADPAFHAVGHMAGGAALVVALALAAGVGFVHAGKRARWMGAAALGAAAFLEPQILWWAPALLFLTLLRGHVYAAPRHLGLAFAQVLAAPVVGALLGWFAGSGLPDCLVPPRHEGWLLGSAAMLGGNRVAVHNPAVWFGGLGALVVLAGTAAWAVLGRFRIQRLPGRVHFRLPEPLSRANARSLWLLLIAAFAPIPIVALPLLGIALAAGVREFSEDAPGFGYTVGAIVVGFAAVYVFRLWGLAAGNLDAFETTELATVTPWTTVHTCA